MPTPHFEKTVVGKKMEKAIKANIFSEYEAIAIYLCMKHCKENGAPIGDFWDQDIVRLLKEWGK